VYYSGHGKGYVWMKNCGLIQAIFMILRFLHTLVSLASIHAITAYGSRAGIHKPDTNFVEYPGFPVNLIAEYWTIHDVDTPMPIVMHKHITQLAKEVYS
jgi:hypothetical protein